MLSKSDLEYFLELWDSGAKWPFIEEKIGLSKYQLKKIAKENGREGDKQRANYSLKTTLYDRSTYGSLLRNTGHRRREMLEVTTKLPPTLEEIFAEEDNGV